MYIKVQILLTGTIKCYWFINLDLLHLLALTLQNFQGRTWNLFGGEIFFIWFIIAHIKTVRKASLVLFFTVDSIYANLLLQIFDNIKTTITMVIWISFPQSFKNHPHFTNLKALIPIFCDITQVNKYQSSVTENTELDGHVISSPSDLLKVELSNL